MHQLKTRLLGLTLAVGAIAAAPAGATVTFLGAAAIPGTGSDNSGLTGMLEDGITRGNALNGFTSAIAYTGVGDRWLLLPDRGPNAVPYPGGAPVDYTQSWQNRVQAFDIRVGQGAGGDWQVDARYADTTLLSRADGQPYIGLSSAYDVGGANARLDPEGVQVGPDGSIYASDEYGPRVLRFDSRGVQTGTFLVPDYLTIANPAATANAENNANPASGGVSFADDPRRVTNRGMEGLTLTPDGSRLVGMMQNALQQDGGTSGTRVRILAWDTANPSAAPAEYVYDLNIAAGNGMVVSEILAVSDREFLLIERDKDQGSAVQAKRIVRIDISGATDVSGTAALDDFAGTLVTADQALFLDLVGNANGLIDAASFAAFKDLLTDTVDWDLYPEKLEGIAFGPDLPDGRRLLLIGNDNDFRDDQPNYIFAFAVDRADLPGLPVPPGLALLLPGLAALTLRGARRGRPAGGG